MTIEVVQLVKGVLTIKLGGVLTDQEIGQLRLAMRQAVDQWIRIRVLMLVEDSMRWDATSASASHSLSMRHEGAIEKLAIVGDKKHEEAAKHFAAGDPSEVDARYFALDERDQAVVWVTDGL